MRARAPKAIAALSTLALLIVVPATASAQADAAKPVDKPTAAAQPIPTHEVKAKPGSRFGVTEQGPFSESTTVRGKIDTDLTGVWLLVSNVEVAPGKFRNFPQILKVAKSDKGPVFHLLDVQLPESITASVKAAKVDRWQPTPEMRKTLASDYAKLPLVKEKTIQEMMFDKITYELADPAHYAELGQNEAKLDKALQGSKFAMRMTENYRPRELPKDVAITQLAQRVTIYGFKKVDKDTMEGEQLAGFIAVGMGTPLPFTFNGPFTMYRLAS
jgi:hypothetical protein